VESQGKCVLACMKFGQLVLKKIIEIVATRCQILRLKCTKFGFGWSSAPDPLRLFHWSLLTNTVVIVVTVYMSIAVRNSMHFVLYSYCEK